MQERQIHLWLHFQKIEKQISSEIEQALKRSAHAMTLNEFYVLHFLDETHGNNLRMNDLSEKIGLSLSATSRMLDRFEGSCGVIQRHPCTEDKRGVRIYLTEKGVQALKEASERVEEVLQSYQEILEIVNPLKEERGE